MSPALPFLRSPLAAPVAPGLQSHLQRAGRKNGGEERERREGGRGEGRGKEKENGGREGGRVGERQGVRRKWKGWLRKRGGRSSTHSWQLVQCPTFFWLPDCVCSFCSSLRDQPARPYWFSQLGNQVYPSTPAKLSPRTTSDHRMLGCWATFIPAHPHN